MKKLFTLVALLAMVLGANAQQGKWEKVYSIDYTTYNGFPFFVMGYVPEFDTGCMTDYGSNYRYETQANLDGDGDSKWKDGESSVGTTKTSNGTEYQKVTGAGPYWHQYFIADGIPTKIDGKYKVIAKVKASNACSINVNMGWGWGGGQQMGANVAIPGDTEFQTVEWQYEGIGGSSCNLVAQPGTVAETIEWQSLEVYEWQKEGGRVPEWLEDIENGDAETPWTAEQAAIKYNDTEKNFTICAWSKEKGHNMDDNGEAWNPFPATIVTDPDDSNNHVFLVDGQPATTEGDPSAWDNQFWIQSKHAWKAGTTLKIKFRYKCNSSNPVKTNTQIHKQNPSDYLIWHAIGDITFTDQWQTFEKDMSISDDMNGGWSIAFNLNPEVKDAVKFYFDDLSWKYLKLDEGYFVSGINANTTTSYDDLDNAIEFTEGPDGILEATVGVSGDATTYVDQVMISTTRGDDQAFKGATLKPSGKITNDPDNWMDFTASTNAKLDLPGLGVWKVYLDLDYNSMAFEMLEGTPYEEAQPVDVVTNKTEFVVNAVERDWRGKDNNGNLIEEQEGTGQPWDNQFWIAANRDLKKDEVTVLTFKYKSSIDAKTSTQCHKMGDDGKPCTYMHWAAIGDVNFQAGDWQDFTTTFKVAADADGMRSITFNMAEIKAACDYYIKDVQWYLKDETLDPGMTYENLIDAEGTKNFWIKIGANTAPYQYGTDPSGITNIEKNVTTSSAIYNIAGQRVSKDFKGLVVKDGKKMLNK
jgi:hypothetical protein